MNILRYRFRGTLYIADIRLLIFIKRRWHADCNSINILNERVVRCGGKLAAFYNLFQGIADNIANVIFPGIYSIDFLGLYVETNGAKAGLCKFNGERKPHITESNDPNNSCFVFNFF